MFIGTGYFSNCKACGKKVRIRLRNCPHCNEPDPQLRNWLGWRVDYTKDLDPSVSSKWKSVWPFRTRIGKRLKTFLLIAIVVTILAVDYLSPALLIEFLRMPPEFFESWWSALLYTAMYIVVAICLVTLLRGKD